MWINHTAGGRGCEKHMFSLWAAVCVYFNFKLPSAAEAQRCCSPKVLFCSSRSIIATSCVYIITRCRVSELQLRLLWQRQTRRWFTIGPRLRWHFDSVFLSPPPMVCLSVHCRGHVNIHTADWILLTQGRGGATVHHHHTVEPVNGSMWKLRRAGTEFAFSPLGRGGVLGTPDP